MNFDVWIDLVCPWCFIGKTRLDRAVARDPNGGDINIHYRSYRLGPKGILEPESIVDKMVSRGMSRTMALEKVAHSGATAAQEGLTFKTNDRLVGDTTDAHCLLQWGWANGRQNAVVQRLFEAHFIEGRPIFTTSEIASVAAQIGLESAEVINICADKTLRDCVDADDRLGQSVITQGIPTIVLNGRDLIPGGQTTDSFLALFRKIRESDQVGH